MKRALPLTLLSIIGITILGGVMAVTAANAPAQPVAEGISVACALIGLYFLPALIAANRNKLNRGSILALNFFLGWSLIGWVVALVWALAADQPPAVVYAATATATAPDARFCSSCGSPSTGQYCQQCGKAARASA